MTGKITITIGLHPWAIGCLRLLATATLYHLPASAAERIAEVIIRRGIRITR